jgi:hypothetical protein
MRETNKFWSVPCRVISDRRPPSAVRLGESDLYCPDDPLPRERTHELAEPQLMVWAGPPGRELGAEVTVGHRDLAA